MSEEVSLPDERLKYFYSRFNELRCEAKFHDITIEVENHCFPCHRLVLVSAMEYFRATMDFDAKKDRITLQEVKAHDFNLLLDYVYGVPIKMQEENVFGLLQISDMFGVQSLEDACVNFIVKSHSIAFDIGRDLFLYACKRDLSTIKDKLIDDIAKNIEDVLRNDDFIEIPGNGLLQILAASDSSDNTSTAILNFLNRWVKVHQNEDIIPDLWVGIDSQKISLSLILKFFMNNITKLSGMNNGICAREPDSVHMEVSLENRDEKSEKSFQKSNVESTYISEEDSDYSTRKSAQTFNRITDKIEIVYGTKRFQEKELPFMLFTQDQPPQLLHEDETINMYKLNAKHDCLFRRFIGTHELVDVSQFEDLHCKSTFIDQHRFTVICTTKKDKPTTSCSTNSSAFGTPVLSHAKFSFNCPSISVPTSATQSSNASNAGDTTSNHSDAFNFGTSSYPSYHLKLHFCGYSKKLRALKTHFVKTNLNKLENFSIAQHSSNIYSYCGLALVMYNSHRNEWSNISKFEIGLGNVPTSVAPCLLCCSSSLYLAGGKYFSTAGLTAQMVENDGKLLQHYDIREGKWSLLAEMKNVHYKSAACIHNDILYVSGGAHYKHGFSVEYYDLKAGKWNILEKPMPQLKMNHSLVAYGKQLWFFGGQKYNSDEIVPDMSYYSYNLEEDKWSGIHYLPQAYSAQYFTTKILDVINVEL